MIEFGKSARFDTLRQRLAEQARMISKKGWYPEMLEICRQVNSKPYKQDLPVWI